MSEEGDDRTVAAGAEPTYEGEEKAATPERQAAELSEKNVEFENSLTFDSHGWRHSSDFPAELKAMWDRLLGRGVSIAERVNMNMHNGVAALELDNREEAVIKAFRALDVDDTGNLHSKNLQALVTLDEPDTNAGQVSSDCSSPPKVLAD
jgi:hypothetical protein